MKRVLVATLIAAVSATSANAAVMITRIGDAYSNNNGGTEVVYRNDFNTSQDQNQVQGVRGTDFIFQNENNQFGAPIAPVPGSTANQYLSVLGNGSATLNINPALGANSFFVDLGSIDSYNNLRITFNGGSAPVTFTGSDIVAPNGPANGDQSSMRTNGRFLFSGIQGFTSVTFSSGQNSFEIDNFRAAVPEPATWAMMIGGFGLVGGAMRRRSRNVRFA